MKSVQRTVFTAISLSLATGCTWVDLDKGANEVGILNPSAAMACTRIGKTTASTTDSVALIPRSRSKVREELRTIARNSAAKMGGDAIAPLTPENEGRQEFGIYRCAPPEVPDEG